MPEHLRAAAGAEMQMESEHLGAAAGAAPLPRCSVSHREDGAKVFSLQYSGERNMTHTMNWLMEPRPAVMLDTWSALRVVVVVGEATIGSVFVSQHLA